MLFLIWVQMEEAMVPCEEMIREEIDPSVLRGLVNVVPDEVS